MRGHRNRQIASFEMNEGRVETASPTGCGHYRTSNEASPQ
jgi:hypothetical protein